MAAIKGTIPDATERAKRILADPDQYFAEARERHRKAILAERAARRKISSRFA